MNHDETYIFVSAGFFVEFSWQSLGRNIDPSLSWARVQSVQMATDHEPCWGNGIYVLIISLQLYTHEFFYTPIDPCIQAGLCQSASQFVWEKGTYKCFHLYLCPAYIYIYIYIYADLAHKIRSFSCLRLMCRLVRTIACWQSLEMISILRGSCWDLSRKTCGSSVSWFGGHTWTDSSWC